MNKQAQAQFAPGAAIQPTGRPEFAGRVLRLEGDRYIVRGGFARHPGQLAWEYKIAVAVAEPYSGTLPLRN